MELTRQNLLRINDVVAEMGRNMENLKRQARKAERYNLYAREQRDAELHVASHRYLEHLAARKTAALQLEQAEEVCDTLRNVLEASETRLESLRIEEAEARTELESARQQAMAVDGGITLLEKEISHLEEGLERIKREEASLLEQQLESDNRMASNHEERRILETRLSTIASDAYAMTVAREESERRARDARDRLVELGREFDAKRELMSRCRARVAGSQSAIEAYSHRIEEAAARLESTRSQSKTIEMQIAGYRELLSGFESRLTVTQDELAILRTRAREQGEHYEQLVGQVHACDEERQAVREELTAKASRLESLHELNNSLDRHDNGVRQAVEALREAGVDSFDGLFIDFIACPRELEVALAAALSDRLQSLVTGNAESGFALLAWLKERDLGRVCAIPMTLCTAEGALPVVEGPGVRGRLIDLLQVDDRVSGAAERLLRDVFVVESEADARRLWECYSGQASFVTLDGQFIDITGAMRGGRPSSPGADLLEQKREIRELEGMVNALRMRSSDLEQRFEETREEMRRCGEMAEQSRSDAQRMEFLLSEVDKDRNRAAEDLESALEKCAHVERDVAQQSEQLERMTADRDRVQAELEAAGAEHEKLSVGIEEQSALIAALQDEADRLAAEVTEARMREIKVKHQHEAAIERSQQIAAIEEDVTAALERIARRRNEIVVETGRTAGRIVAAREKLADQLNHVDRVNALVAQATQRLDDRMQVFAEAQSLFKAKRTEVEDAHEKVSELQMSLQKSESDIDHLLLSAREKHDVDLPRILGDFHLRDIPDRVVFDRIEELKSLISRMGSINSTAIEEYADIAQRYEQKVTQKADVEQALEDLESAIARMDKDSRRMFKETFDAVNEKFQEIFPRLFKGGHARLLLTDPDDMLTTGVDIVASPPGKKLSNIDLMSGGEKALTAVSLLFAIFMQRPSPFCLLDEVDAPFDEANVGRFVDMVREMADRSQFVIITHSKVTMEGADTLYGVTMQEPGISKMISVNLVHRESARMAN